MSKYTQLLSEQAREKIEEYIDRQKIAPHTALPAERELAKILNFNRLTLRTALRQMRDEGAIYTIHGRGNFLSSPKYLEDSKSFISYTAGWESDGYQVHSKQISLKVIEATKRISDKLDLPLGTPVYELKRVRYLDGNALFLETAYLPVKYCEGLHNYRFENRSLYKTLETEYHIKLVRQNHVISVAALTREESAYLEAPEGTSAFFIRGVTYDDTGRAVEYCVSLNRADLYAITSCLVPE